MTNQSESQPLMSDQNSNLIGLLNVCVCVQSSQEPQSHRNHNIYFQKQARKYPIVLLDVIWDECCKKL